jgi:hypothetical protein
LRKTSVWTMYKRRKRRRSERNLKTRKLRNNASRKLSKTRFCTMLRSCLWKNGSTTLKSKTIA